MGPLNQLLQNNISLIDPLELSPIQKNNKLSAENIQRSSKPLNKKWVATGAVLALTSVASALAVGYRYFKEKNNIIPPEPTSDPLKITVNTIIDLAVLAGMAYLAKTIFFKDTIITKNETPFSKQSQIGNNGSLSEPAEAKTILENFNKAESCKTDETPFLEECKKVNEYLKEYVYSPNEDQKLLIQTFVTSLKTTVNATHASVYLLENFPEIIENAYGILLDIDQNSAFDILKTCINIDKCPFAWQCGVFIEKTLKAINTDDRLVLFLAKKFNQKSITIDEFNTVIKYLNRSNLPVLDASLKSLFQAFTDFLLEKIHNPEENHEQLSLTLKSVFHLLLYKFIDYDSVLTIAKSCINLSDDASENLKKQCELIIKTVLQHNTGIALKLVKHCAKITNESNQKNIQQYLTWYLEAENYRINNSFNNLMKKVVAKIYDQRPKEDTFEIQNTLSLRPFLRFSSGIKNPILQNCIVNAFEAIIKEDLKKYHNYNSEILECTFKFLTHENMENYDTNENMPNYELALSLLKIYISSMPTNLAVFIKGAYQELLTKSSETAVELELYCQNCGIRGLANHIKDKNDYGSEDDSPDPHKEIENMGTLTHFSKF